MVSDFTESFEASTRIFFGHEIKLDWYPLWK
jgi:glutamate racemase